MTRDLDEEKRKYVESIKGFDGTEFLKNYKLTINLDTVEPNQNYPLGFFYEFNLFSPDNEGKSSIRVLAAGNSHAPDIGMIQL